MKLRDEIRWLRLRYDTRSQERF